MAYKRKTTDIFISEEIKRVLLEIESESLVAHLLLKKRHRNDSLVENNVNYISISTQDKRRISYLTQDRMDKMDESDYWSSTRRYHTKPGAFIGKVFNDISPKEVEKFSNLFKSESDKPYFRFEVVKGDRIKDLYFYEAHSSNDGTLGVSCMKHEECQKFFGVYTQNPDNISMLVMFDENDKVLGRSLLWDFDSHKLMDRIYTVYDEKYSSYFKKWCVDNGYLHKSEQNWYNTFLFEQFGNKRVDLRLKVTLSNPSHEYYPYMDTFKFIDNNGTLYNYQPDGVGFKTLCSTNGSCQDSDSLRFDSVNDIFRYPGDCVWLSYKNIYTHYNNCYYSESNDKHILRDDAVYNEEIGDYIFNEENDSNNNKERIKERVDYYKRMEESRKVESSKSSYSSSIFSHLNSVSSEFIFDRHGCIDPDPETHVTRLTPRVNRQDSNDPQIIVDEIDPDSVA